MRKPNAGRGRTMMDKIDAIAIGQGRGVLSKKQTTCVMDALWCSHAITHGGKPRFIIPDAEYILKYENGVLLRLLKKDNARLPSNTFSQRSKD